MPAGKGRFERWVGVSFSPLQGQRSHYVILPEMLSVLRGRSFPNTRADDPVLAMAMPAGDDHPLWRSPEHSQFFQPIPEIAHL